MRDKRKLQRVREAAQLIQRAVADGWKRGVGVDGRGHGPGQLVTVVLEKHSPKWGGGGRIILLFSRQFDGSHSCSVMSRFLEPRGSKRLGLPKAWAVFFSLRCL